MSGNYYRKLSVEIITGNHQLVYYVAEKCGNYRDTGVSKNIWIIVWLSCLQLFVKLEEPDHHHKTTQMEHSVYLNKDTMVQFGKQIITCIKENIGIEISLQHDNCQTTNS